MKNIIRYSKLMMLLLIGTSLQHCGDAFSTTLDIDPPEFVRQMVLSTTITAGDSDVFFYVGQNRGILEEGDSEDFDLPNAKVTITRSSDGLQFDTEANSIDTMEQFGSVFNYNIGLPDSTYFVPGDSYTFLLEHSEFDNSETTIRFPTQEANLENFEFTEIDGLNIDLEEISSVAFDIVDNPDSRGYFELNANIQIEDGFRFEVDIATTNPIALDAFPDGTLLFRDETFAEETERFIFNYERRFVNDIDSEFIEVVFASINEGLYEYRRSLTRFSDSDGNPFITPVGVTSNVNGALGNIGLRTESRFIVFN